MSPRLLVLCLAPLCACLLGCQGKESPKPRPTAAIEWESSAVHRLHGPGFAVSNDGTAIAVMVGDDIVELQASGDSEDLGVHSYRTDAYRLTEVAYSPDGTWLAGLEAIGSSPLRAYVILRVSAQEPLERAAGLSAICHLEDGAEDLRFSADSKYLSAILGHGNARTAYVASTGQLVGDQAGPTKQLPEVGGITVERSEDKKHLFASKAGHKVEMKGVRGIFHQEFGALSDRAIGALDDAGLGIWTCDTGELELRIALSASGTSVSGPSGKLVFDRTGFLTKPGPIAAQLAKRLKYLLGATSQG